MTITDDFAQDFADSMADIGCTLTFDVDRESYPAEPFSHGGSRGTETTTRATLTEMQIGGLWLDRAKAVALLGPEWVSRLERIRESQDRCAA